MYKSVHAAIRENPEHEAKPQPAEGQVKKKRCAVLHLFNIVIICKQKQKKIQLQIHTQYLYLQRNVMPPSTTEHFIKWNITCKNCINNILIYVTIYKMPQDSD